MNKKIIAILLIFTMISVGFSSLAAEDVNDSNTQTSTQDSQAVANNESSVNQTVEEANNTTANNTTINETFEKQNDEKVYDLIKSMDSNQQKKLLDLLTEMKISNYNDLIKLLKNKNLSNETEFYKALSKLNDNEFYTLYLISNDIHSQKDTVVKKDDLNKFPSKIRGTVTKITSDDSKKASDNSIWGIFTGNSKSDSYKLTVSDKYYILNDLMKGYLDGSITFEEFKYVLKSLGFDTNGMKLNPDGSITWNGITIPSPYNTVPPTNTNSTNTTNTTNTTNDTNTASDSSNQASSDSSSSANSQSSQASDNSGSSGSSSSGSSGSSSSGSSNSGASASSY